MEPRPITSTLQTSRRRALSLPDYPVIEHVLHLVEARALIILGVFSPAWDGGSCRRRRERRIARCGARGFRAS